MKFARRQFLTLGAGALAAASVSGRAKAETAQNLFHPTAPPNSGPINTTALPLTDIRKANIHNLDTGETLDAVYWENGEYLPDALAEAMRVMRDTRDGTEHVMDPRLLDVLHGIQSKLEVKTPFQLICGYRSPETNAILRAESREVARHSQHMLGKASDIYMHGVQLGHLHKAALSLRAGGVGLYPVSDFIHVDVGPVRRWTGT